MSDEHDDRMLTAMEYCTGTPSLSPGGGWRQPPTSYASVQQMVEDAVKEHDAEGGGKVTHAQLQNSVTTAREVKPILIKLAWHNARPSQSIMRTIDTQLHGARTQITDDVQNEVEALRNEMMTKLTELKTLANGTKDSLERTQAEMVRVLNKKVYKGDVQRWLQDKVDRSDLEPLAKESIVQQMIRTKVALTYSSCSFLTTHRPICLFVRTSLRGQITH